MVNSVHMIDILGREFYLCDFIKYIIVQSCDAFELITFKLAVMLKTTKLCNMIPVGMTLIFSQGHSLTGACAVIVLESGMR